jgi:hypothetical protein
LPETSILSGVQISSTHLRVATWEQVSKSFSLFKETPRREIATVKEVKTEKVMNRKGRKANINLLAMFSLLSFRFNKTKKYLFLKEHIKRLCII